MFCLVFAFYGMDKSVFFPVNASSFAEAERIGYEILKASGWTVGRKGDLAIGQAAIVGIESSSAPLNKR